MKRGRNFFRNENLLIYIGTAIFFILAISIGIVMYMGTKKDESATIENNQPNLEEANLETDMSEEKNAESVSTEIGKTVEEQQNTNTTQVQEESKSNVISNTKTDQKENTVVEEKITKTENKETKSEVKKEITFVKPVEGEIIGEFAKDNLIYSETLKEWITHTGIDIKSDKTSVVKASADGIIKSIINDPRYGLTVVIEHDEGYETIYSNLLTAEFVVEGEEVKAGQTIGTVGNTASFETNMESHLHFELIKDGEYLDPNIYLNK